MAYPESDDDLRLLRTTRILAVELLVLVAFVALCFFLLGYGLSR